MTPNAVNAALMLVYNRTPAQLELTKLAIASVLAQDIPVDLTVIDNGSTPDTAAYLNTLSSIRVIRNETNISPCRVANTQLERIFTSSPHILCLPNDVILPPNLYCEFLKWPRGIVTGSQTHDRSYDLSTPIEVQAVSENTPMAVLLLRKWAYDALIAKDGYFFDEQFEHYCSDCDWALRTASCGIRGIQLNLIYYHYGSASVKLNTPENYSRMAALADADRKRFREKWNFGVSDLEYGQRAVDLSFRGESVKESAPK